MSVADEVLRLLPDEIATHLDASDGGAQGVPSSCRWGYGTWEFPTRGLRPAWPAQPVADRDRPHVHRPALAAIKIEAAWPFRLSQDQACRTHVVTDKAWPAVPFAMRHACGGEDYGRSQARSGRRRAVTRLFDPDLASGPFGGLGLAHRSSPLRCRQSVRKGYQCAISSP